VEEDCDIGHVIHVNVRNVDAVDVIEYFVHVLVSCQITVDRQELYDMRSGYSIPLTYIFLELLDILQQSRAF
jgi:hypothetical protein